MSVLRKIAVLGIGMTAAGLLITGLSGSASPTKSSGTFSNGWTDSSASALVRNLLTHFSPEATQCAATFIEAAYTPSAWAQADLPIATSQLASACPGVLQ